MKKTASKACSDHAFHVDHNETSNLWDVVDDDGVVLGHCPSQQEAIHLAIREAQHTHGRGQDVVVCVQQPDGHYALAWSGL